MDMQMNGWLCRQLGQLLKLIPPFGFASSTLSAGSEHLHSYFAQDCFVLALVVERMPASVLPNTEPQPHGLFP